MNEYTLRLALPKDGDKIYCIMQKVYNSLEDKSLFVCDDMHFIREHINKSGFAVIADTENSETAACLIVRYPGNADDNLGKDIGISKKHLYRIAHMESAVVLPEHRGKSLQYQMIKFAEQMLDTGKYRYILSTVSPDNKFSSINLIKCGYRFVMNKLKYDGLSRDIYIKYLI